MATMSNEKIILSESLKLMQSGIIKGSGKFLPLEDGSEIELPEAIHTYNGWKQLGYQVQKGQKAKAQFSIWQYGKSKKDDKALQLLEGNPEAEAKGHFFMKMSSFFTADQVKPIEAK